MKLYAGRFLRNSTQRQVDGRVESRDAFLKSIDYVSRRAIVRIQGSSADVVAYFPENMASAEQWLKPGNAVRISHTGGHRGRIELVGHGATIPTPTAGGSYAIPAAGLADAVLSGLALRAYYDQISEPANMGGIGMWVYVSTGSYRINGVIYTLGPAPLGSGTPLGGVATLGTVGAFVHLPGSPVGGDMYTKLVIGADGVIDVISSLPGNPPAMPDTPADHVSIGWVLKHPGMLLGNAVIHSYNVNATVSPRMPMVTMTTQDSTLSWAELSTAVYVSVRDQYGAVLDGISQVTMEITHGNGVVSNSIGSASLVAVTSILSNGDAIFGYTRFQIASGENRDISPVLTVKVLGANNQYSGMITLLDADGVAM